MIISGRLFEVALKESLMLGVLTTVVSKERDKLHGRPYKSLV